MRRHSTPSSVAFKQKALEETQKTRQWLKVCLHSVIRGIIVGNIYSQYFFTNQEAMYYLGTNDIANTEVFVRSVNWEVGIFVLTGTVVRAFLVFVPSQSVRVSYIGLMLWMIGIIVAAIMSRFVSYSAIQAVTYSLVDVGGGLYLWGSLDEIIRLTSGDCEHPSFVAVFGCFSVLYTLGVHLIYYDLASVATGFMLIYSYLLFIMIPMITMLIIEECTANALTPTTTLIATPIAVQLKAMTRSTTIRSFALHILFIFIFHLFVQLPPLVLSVSTYSLMETDLLLYWRGLGMMLGQCVFAFLYKWAYVPTITSFLLPLVISEWIYDDQNVASMYVIVFFYGFFVGLLHVWVIFRVIEEWMRNMGTVSLAVYLFIMTLMSVPGNLLLNPLLATVDSPDALVTPSIILYMALGLSICCTIAITLHWCVYYTIEGKQKM